MEVRQEYRIALEVCPTPLMIVSHDGKIMLSNKRLNALFGYEDGELENQSVEILVPEKIRRFHPELREAFFEVPTSRNMGTGRDLFGVRNGGEMIPVEIGLDPIVQDGEALVLVSVLDIRERKLDEIKIRRAINAASNAMVMINEHGKVELINTQTESMFGYGADELIGSSIEKLVPERHRRKHAVYRMSYQNTRNRRSMGTGRELFGLRKDGSEFPVEIGLTPIDGPEGRLIMATINDVTERKQAEQSIHHKNKELRRLNDELSEFAYSASHDLKAPLSSITGLLQFCEADLDAGSLDEVRENIENARQLAVRLAGRIESMLALAKTDNLENEWERLSFKAAVADMWQTLQASTPSQVKLTTTFGHSDPIWTIRARLYIVLENILSNAIKYRDEEKPDCRVHVETWDDRGVLHVSVQDNGIGIPAEQHENIFKMFKRVADTDEPGCGIGLALVKKNLERLGGDVFVQSTASATTFSITLPQQQNDSRSDVAKSELEDAG